MLGFHETPLRVQFGQVDRYGSLWHGHAASYFELARADIVRPFGLGAQDLSRSGLTVPMVDFSVEYRAIAREDEELVVQSTMLRPQLPLPLLHFHYRLVRSADGKEILRGSTRQVLVRSNGRPLMRIPPEQRERLDRMWSYLASCPRWPC